MTHPSKKIPFLIDHIDPLGQGVYKNAENIYFIRKTLVGESGEASIYKSKGKIHFAELESIHQESENRIEPKCPHFTECNGCHFLHTDYEHEISLKKKSFEHMLKSLEVNSIEVIAAPERFFYRNRIQLHYNKKQKKIGFINPVTRKITPVSNCLIVEKDISNFLKEFELDWPNRLPKRSKNYGHVEIYLKADGIKLSWNKRYAEGGFTQVYKKMNNKLQELIQKHIPDSHYVLDLFGGNGNLSQVYEDKLIIDFYKESVGKQQLHLDLFSAEALQKFLENTQNSSFDSLIIDPPRKGFPAIKDWIRELKPSQFVYVSCHPQTMIRDLKEVKDLYNIDYTYMLDLFPGTYHFEAMCILSKKE